MDQDIIKNMNRRGENLSIYACTNDMAERLKPADADFRPEFFRDIDKIIYSLSYIRYVDKTQVFSNVSNDMISKRMTHVQMVSKIARTIGRALNLNEDLIEAASLGHDLGHTPFGHVGESILNNLSMQYNEGYFNHNVQSVRTLMDVENNGNGSNITIQVLDAIFCHNGEKLEQIYTPKSKTKDEFLKEYNDSYRDKDSLKRIKPMTLEGCVIRISDIIAYIGRDIEDAIRLNKITIDDVPSKIKDVLGDNNSKIVNTIVKDIIVNSIDNNYIKLSDEIFDAMNKLIKFNYENIYLKANTKEQIDELEVKFNKLFKLYYNQIINGKSTEDIYTKYLNDMNDIYNGIATPARKTIDYIAGMTDDYFNDQYKKYFH